MIDQFDFQLTPKSDWIFDDRNPVLRKKTHDLSLPLDKNDLDKISQMICYIDSSANGTYGLHQIKPGIAVAANQVNYLKKVIYVNFSISKDISYRYLLANPKITFASSQMCYLTSGEGCLSVNHPIAGHVLRHHEIIVSAINLFDDRSIEIHAQSILAICLQHEIDHLSGILFYDRIDQKHPFIKNKNHEYIEI